MAKRKTPTGKRPRPTNGPFFLKALDGARRFGLAGEVADAPLVIEALGSDGAPPHNRAGKPVPVRIAFKVVRVPAGADTRLVGGSRKRMVVETDAHGRASVPVQLGEVEGRYVFEALPLDLEDSAGVDFTALTEGVSAVLLAAPVQPAVVGRVMPVRVRAYDWRGEPVRGARLEAVVQMSFQPETVPFYQARERAGGRYRFSIRHPVAGDLEIEVVDLETDTRTRAPATLLPGRVRSLSLPEPSNPREEAPYDATGVDVVATDRFGNLVADAEIEWSCAGGTLEPRATAAGATASAWVRFGEEGRIVVRAASGRARARLELALPGTYVRFVESRDFAFAGERFHVWLEVFPPPGGGTVEAINTCILEPAPEAAKLRGVSQAHPENGLPAPAWSQTKGGVLEVTVDGAEVPIPESGGRLVIAELEYECCADNVLACFEALPGTITIARSPGKEFPLPADFFRCDTQKRRRPRTLCLNICIPVKPGGGKTFAQHKADVEAQITRTQAIFDENIGRCCPKISILSCINELDWRTYDTIAKGGEVRDVLEQYIYNGPENDANKDIYQLSAEIKNLLKQCRKPNCVSIYYVPEHRYKSGNAWYKSNGATISPNDFPQTTSATNSGPGIVMSQGLNVADHTLVHELGHLLIDNQRGTNGGVEHVDDGNTRRVMKKSAPGGREFIRAECERIFRNVGQYGGDCR